ncbi:MAG: hypothetical protein IPK26_12475 [Planctomycetes bacterium]|nr:hypothetical protein [Planctomycetota bacterium]
MAIPDYQRWQSELAGTAEQRRSACGEICEHAWAIAGRRIRTRLHTSMAQRWEQTGDLWSDISTRLWNMLRTGSVPLKDDRHLLNLTNQVAGRVLVDMLRRHYGERGMGNLETRAAVRSGDGASEAPTAEAVERDSVIDLMMCREFHEWVAKLEEPARELCYLKFYSGMTDDEAAAIVIESARNVRRDWALIRVRIAEAAAERWPD